MIKVLRALYKQNADEGMCNLRHIVDVVLHQCCEMLSCDVVLTYIRDRKYRLKHQPVAKTSRRVKTDDENAFLEEMWRHLEGAYPTRNDPMMQACERKFSLTFEEVRQWFGQKRYTTRQKTRRLQLDMVVDDPPAGLVVAQECGYGAVFAHGCAGTYDDVGLPRQALPATRLKTIDMCALRAAADGTACCFHFA